MTNAWHEYSEWPPEPGFVPNGPVLERLTGAILRGDRIIELVGAPGTGKTAMLRYLAHNRPASLSGVVQHHIADALTPSNEIVDVIAEGFQRSSGRNLLVIDEADRTGQAYLLSVLDRLAARGISNFVTILATTEPMKMGQAVHLGPMNFDEMGALLRSRLLQDLPDDVLRKLWSASQGIPRLAGILVHRWQAGEVSDFDALANLLNPFAVPGLVDSQGRPLARGSHQERTIISDVRFVTDELLKEVSRDPNLVQALTSREFEELSAELFARQGYSVTITKKTRDGGKDLYLAKADGFGSFLYIVECKRYAPDRPVDIGVVRALYGVAQHERVTAAMTLTTSYFSKDAQDFAADLQYQLSLKDFIDLKLLLAPHGRA